MVISETPKPQAQFRAYIHLIKRPKPSHEDKNHSVPSRNHQRQTRRPCRTTPRLATSRLPPRKRPACLPLQRKRLRLNLTVRDGLSVHASVWGSAGCRVQTDSIWRLCWIGLLGSMELLYPDRPKCRHLDLLIRILDDGMYEKSIRQRGMVTTDHPRPRHPHTIIHCGTRQVGHSHVPTFLTEISS